jgi:hypothetical protein
MGEQVTGVRGGGPGGRDARDRRPPGRRARSLDGAGTELGRRVGASAVNEARVPTRHADTGGVVGGWNPF